MLIGRLLAFLFDHHTFHEDGGDDEISVAGLAGETADLATHKANTTTAHGAVSAATASKHVVRDASARAKFAAPNATGDALIKGTPITSGEYPAVTDENYLVGTGASMEERAVPTAPKADAEGRVHDAASGDVAYTGYGFTPTALIMVCWNTSHTGSAGMSEPSKAAACIYHDAVAVRLNPYICWVGANVANHQEAIIKSYDADGFTLTWTKAGAGAGADIVMHVIAFK